MRGAVGMLEAGELEEVEGSHLVAVVMRRDEEEGAMTISVSSPMD